MKDRYLDLDVMFFYIRVKGKVSPELKDRYLTLDVIFFT